MLLSGAIPERCHCRLGHTPRGGAIAGEVVGTSEPQPDNSFTTITSDPHLMCVTCTNNNNLNAIVWQNLPCESTFDYTTRDGGTDPATSMCHCRESPRPLTLATESVLYFCSE